MKLSEKQKRFCREYIIDLNGAQAAIRAGYSKKTARVQASDLLTKPNIQEFIAHINEKISNKLEITKERIIAEHAKIAFSDVKNIFDESGNLRSLAELKNEVSAAISSVETEELHDKKGNFLGRERKLKLWNKQASLEAIAKLLGYNVEKGAINIHIEQPLFPEE